MTTHAHKVLDQLLAIPMEVVTDSKKKYGNVFTDVAYTDERILDLKKDSPKYGSFVEAVKEIIDAGEDWKNKISLTFNSSYTKLKIYSNA